MCGIVGYIGDKEAFPIIRDALSRIEYRGYDSFGFATFGDSLHFEKRVGAVTSSDIANMSGTVGVGHTRWATHGGVEERNAHPHVSSSGRFVIVHNGIIENFLQLKGSLQKKGTKFKSDTDTEVIVQLMDDAIKGSPDFFDAAKVVIDSLHGSFAFALFDDKSPNKVVLTCVEAPMRIGIKGDEVFFASDPVAFLPYSREVISLSDGDVAFIDRNNITIRNRSDWSKEMSRAAVRIDWDRADVSKDGFVHFMLKEIYEQKNTLELAPDDYLLEKAGYLIRQAKSVWITGCGTAFHAGLVGARMLLGSGIDARACLASGFDQYFSLLDDEDVIIAVSQSGETADLLSVIRSAKRLHPGIDVISVTNAVGSTLTSESSVTLYTNCGVEVAVASTKAYTAQIGVFHLLDGAVKDEKSGLKKRKDELLHLRKLIDSALSSRIKAQYLAKALKSRESIYLIGHRSAAVSCFEGALKIKEISYIHAEGMPAAELKHGTLALIEDGVPCIVVIDDVKDLERTVSSAMEIKARGGFIIGISEKDHPVFDEWIAIPASPCPEMVSVIPLQLLAYELAVARGNDPDKPRNLAKSVTVH
jgi:glucosamine--fructose-6-phosphate aminotransferase (isomerizing)